MKSFSALTNAQQERAIQETLRRLVHAIVAGDLRFNDIANGNDLQARIDHGRQLTVLAPDAYPGWLLLHCTKDLQILARETAVNAVYREGETVIELEDL